MGLFDETIDPQQGVSLTPTPGLDPLSAPQLGIPPALLQGAMPPMPSAPMQAPVQMPTPPQAPPPPGAGRNLLSLALLGLAAGLGPRHGGGGIAAGLSAGQDANEADRRQKFKDDQAQYVFQQNEAIRQQQLQETQARVQAAAQAQREKNLQGALMSIQADVKKLPDKATYDQRIEGYANLLRGSGYRVDANWLRQAAPYIAPDQKAKAQEAVAAFFKNPINAQALKDNPEQVANGSIKFDANGDGVAEIIPLRKLLDMAQMSVVTNEKGQPLTLSPSTQGDNMQVALRAKLAKFRAENNREPNPKEMDALVTEARTPVKDPDMQALARTSAELSNQLKQAQLGQQPTPEQEDMYAKLLTTNKMAPSQVQILAGGMGQQGKAFLRNVTAKALQQNPDFSWEEAESTYQLVKSPSFQNTVRYMDSVVESMPRLQQTANQLGNGNVRSLNALINAAKDQASSVPLKKFKTDVLFVSDEIAKILQGGGTGSGTSDAKLRQAGEILSTSDSPRAIAAALGEAAALMGNRRSALTRGTYLDKPAPQSTDPAASARQKLQNR
jgi:hypothetical protein